MNLMRAMRIIGLSIGAAGVLTLGVAATVQDELQGLSYKQLSKTQNYSIDVSESSVKARLDGDGDTLVTGIIRITRSDPIDMNGQPALVFINLVTSVCGYSGVVVHASRAYTKEGATISTQVEPRTIKIEKQDTPGAVVYDYMCKNIKKPTGKGRSYNPNMV